MKSLCQSKIFVFTQQTSLALHIHVKDYGEIMANKDRYVVIEKREVSVHKVSPPSPPPPPQKDDDNRGAMIGGIICCIIIIIGALSR